MNTESTLSELVALAREQVPVGARYQHYKNPSHTYIVRGIALIEETLSPAVLYEAEYGDALSFIRPLSNFLESVSHHDMVVPRFTRISEPLQDTE